MSLSIYPLKWHWKTLFWLLLPQSPWTLSKPQPGNSLMHSVVYTAQSYGGFVYVSATSCAARWHAQSKTFRYAGKHFLLNVLISIAFDSFNVTHVSFVGAYFADKSEKGRKINKKPKEWIKIRSFSTENKSESLVSASLFVFQVFNSACEKVFWVFVLRYP